METLKDRHPELKGMRSGSVGFSMREKPLGMDRRTWRSLWDTVSTIGFDRQLEASGPDSYGDVWALGELVRDGRLTRRDAERFLTSKYPDQAWSGGAWQNLIPLAAQAAAVDEAARLSTDPARMEVDEISSALQRTYLSRLRGSGSGETEAGLPPTIPELPQHYDRSALQEALNSLASQMASTMAEIANGRALRLSEGSIDGSVLKPGSVPPTVLNARDIHKEVNSIPGPDQAIVLNIRQSDDADRWVDDGTTKGPGRIWKVYGEPELPPNWKPTGGPIRYRLVQDGMRYGVMGITMNTGRGTKPTPGAVVHYGMVVQGIPHWLEKPPTKILEAKSLDDAPVSFGSDAPVWGVAFPGASRLFHDRADNDYRVATYPTFTAIGADAKLTPTAANYNGCAGFSFYLLTGDNAHRVYQELNSRSSNMGQRLLGEAPGPGRSCPSGIQHQAATVPSVLQWNGLAAALATYTHWDESMDLSTADKLVQGVPFSFDDCDALTATDDRFSVVVEPLFTRDLGQSGTWLSPEHWHEHGVRLESQDGRTWGVDIIVM